MGDLLAAGHMRAAGIHPSHGFAVWGPRETWSLPRSFQGQEEYALWRVLTGEKVRFPIALRSFECHPFLFCRDVALVFGAKTPPDDPPQWVLDSIQDWEGGVRQAPRDEARAVPEASPITHTGYAGRPSARAWIEAEFIRRRDAGEIANTRAAEARELEKRCKAIAGNNVVPVAKTIETHIRDFWPPPQNRRSE